MLESYFEHEKERKKLGIPALPLDSQQVREVCKNLEKPPKGKESLPKSCAGSRSISKNKSRMAWPGCRRKSVFTGY